MKIVYTSGSFDMFHRNHLQMIKYAKKLGDFLIVGVNTDELISSYKNDPIIPFEERLAIIESIKYVDLAIPQKSLDIGSIVNKMNINTFVVGDDWQTKFDYLREENVEVFYFPYGVGVSSSSLKKRIYENYEKILQNVDKHSHPETIKEVRK